LSEADFYEPSIKFRDIKSEKSVKQMSEW